MLYKRSPELLLTELLHLDQHLPDPLSYPSLWSPPFSLYFCEFNCFRFHIQVRSHSICLSVLGWLLSIMSSRLIHHVVTNEASKFKIFFSNMGPVFHWKVLKSKNILQQRFSEHFLDPVWFSLPSEVIYYIMVLNIKPKIQAKQKVSYFRWEFVLTHSMWFCFTLFWGGFQYQNVKYANKGT